MYVAGSFLEKKSEAGQECEKIIIKIPSAIEKKRLEIELFKRFNFFESFGVFQISRLFFAREVGFGCKQNLELGNCCFVVQLS